MADYKADTPTVIGPQADASFVDTSVTPFRMETPGDSITGIFAGSRDSNMEDGTELRQHVVVVKVGGRQTNFGLLGGFVLDSFFDSIGPGTPVQVEFVGTVPSTKAGRSPMKTYRTLVPEAIAERLGIPSLPKS